MSKVKLYERANCTPGVAKKFVQLYTYFVFHTGKIEGKIESVRMHIKLHRKKNIMILIVLRIMMLEKNIFHRVNNNKSQAVMMVSCDSDFRPSTSSACQYTISHSLIKKATLKHFPYFPKIRH